MTVAGLSAEDVYRRLPIALQNAACSAVGLQTRVRRYDTEFRSLLVEAEVRRGWSPDQVVAFRDARLREFLIEASRTTTHWGRSFAELGVLPAEVNSLEDLSRLLPVLTKADVQSAFDTFVPERSGASKATWIHTSGTSGAGLRFPADWHAVREQWAVWWRYWGSHGIEFGTPCAWFGGRLVVPKTQQTPPFWRHNRFGRQTLFSAHHTSPANLSLYLDELDRSGLQWLHGYPSIIAMLAVRMVETGRTLQRPVRWITTGAESLLESQRQVIEQAFGVRPKQHYGLTEAVANISECPLGQLHIDEDFAAVELGPVEGGLCEIVGTNLSNPAFPLIRYATRDLVQPGGPCSCGLPGRTVTKLEGRREDSIVLPDGSRIRGIDHLFKDSIDIREARVHQPAVGRVEISIVATGSFGLNELEAILRDARERFGPGTEVSGDLVAQLPRMSSGKQRLVVSDVDRSLTD